MTEDQISAWLMKETPKKKSKPSIYVSLILRSRLYPFGKDQEQIGIVQSPLLLDARLKSLKDEMVPVAVVIFVGCF